MNGSSTSGRPEQHREVRPSDAKGARWDGKAVGIGYFDSRHPIVATALERAITRLRNNSSLREISREMGVNRQTLRDLLTGKSRRIQPGVFRRIEHWAGRQRRRAGVRRKRVKEMRPCPGYWIPDCI